ncbi:PAS domain S-box protein [Chloroflexota bacterium]
MSLKDKQPKSDKLLRGKRREIKDGGKDEGHNTEHKYGAEELYQSEAVYSTLVEKSNDGIVILQDGIVKFANLRISHFVDYTPEEAIGHHLTDFLSPRYRDMVLKRYEARMRGEKIPENYEIELVAKDGRTVPVEINGSLLEYQGSLSDMVIIRDISERKQAEQALKESEEKYRNLVERANDGIVIVQDGIIVYMNQCLGKICGYTVEEATGTEFADYIHPKELPKVIARYKMRALGEDVPPIYESIVKHKDGNDIYVEFNAANISYLGRTADLVLVRDITERRRAEEQHIGSLKKLQNAMESTVQALARTLEVRDPYTAGHQQRVTQLACAIGRELGLLQIDSISISSAIHDIGKIYVPAELLSKPGRLNEVEFNMIKMHPEAGYDILKNVEFPWPVAAIVHQHHERINGSGYPQGLSGKDILMESRILAIADVVEAISSHRPYRPSLGIEVALGEISKNRNSLYDPTAVDACLNLFNEKNFSFE